MRDFPYLNARIRDFKGKGKVGGGGGRGERLGIKSKNGTRDNENNHRDCGIDRNLGRDNGTEEPYWRLSRYSHFEHDTASRTLVTLKSFLCCYHSRYLTG